MHLSRLLLFFLFIVTSCTGNKAVTYSSSDPSNQGSENAFFGSSQNSANSSFEKISESESLFGSSLDSQNIGRLNYNQPDNTLPRHLLSESGSAFSESLLKGNRLMVYNAAITAVELNPTNSFLNHDLVMPALAEAINLTGVRTLYVVSHNANLRNEVKSFCRNNGYIFGGAANAITALKELHHSTARDLILIDAGLDATDSEGFEADGNGEYPRITHVQTNDRNLPRNALFARELFLEIKADVRTGHIPVVILASDNPSVSEVDRETAQDIYGDQVTAILTKPLNAPALKEVTQRLFHREDKLAKDAKDEAERLATRACGAVHALQGRSTIYDVTLLADSLIEAFREPLEGEIPRVPHLREAAINAMQTVAAPQALVPLMRVVRNPDNDVRVRAAAITCLGIVYQRNSSIVSDFESQTLWKLLSDRLNEEEVEIWSSSANTLGQLGLSSAEKTQIAIANRPNRQRKY